jgi:hypothetical protein
MRSLPLLYLVVYLRYLPPFRTRVRLVTNKPETLVPAHRNSTLADQQPELS